MSKTKKTELDYPENLDIDSMSESCGIVKSLKWVKFLMSYKSNGLILREINKFIDQEEKRHPELKNLTSY